MLSDMKKTCSAMVFLLAAVPVAAPADQDALQKLYGLSQQTTGSDRGLSKAGARQRFGAYGPPETRSAPNPVRSVLHAHRGPSGELIVQCDIEHFFTGNALTDADRASRRER